MRSSATLSRLKILLLLISQLVLLTGCTPPVYQDTVYGIDDFMADSIEISRGKFAILNLENQNNDKVSSQMPDFYEETVIDGDELTIALYNPRRQDRVKSFQAINQTTGFRICDGKVTLPQIGSIEVYGLTLKNLREKIQLAYFEQFKEGQIYVDFKKRRERYVQIIGAKETLIPIDGNTRLNEVLAKSQISPSANLFKSYVMRDDKKLPIDLYKLIHEGNQSQNIIMHGGDQIFLAHGMDATVMVTGEVPNSVVIPILYGFIPLREALAIAGGIPFTGNSNCIRVIRGDFIRPRIYCMSWQDLKHLPNQSLLLMPGDVVVIGEMQITQWNRFINQVQPSAGGIQAGYNVYQLIKKTSAKY